MVYGSHLTTDKDWGIKSDYCNYQTAKTQIGDILIESFMVEEGRGWADERRDIGLVQGVKDGQSRTVGDRLYS